MKVVKIPLIKLLHQTLKGFYFQKKLTKMHLHGGISMLKLNIWRATLQPIILLFFKTNGEKLYPFYNLFFAYCFEFAQNIELLKDVETSIIKHNATQMDDLIYLNNDDMIVIENFQAYVK